MNREARVVQVGMGSAPVAFAQYVYLLKVLAHPTRLGVLQALADSPDYPRSLAVVLKKHEASVSYHLGALAGAGFVSCEQHGKTAVYYLTPSVGARTQRENVVLQFARGEDLLLQLYLPPAASVPNATDVHALREDPIQPPRPKIHGRVRRRER